ncbi:hypothetical protein NE865_12210 [Phthorimaea operculella]|nr:hypothetical protein NE865_12210 [Phthorimaea operculella]
MAPSIARYKAAIKTELRWFTTTAAMIGREDREDALLKSALQADERVRVVSEHLTECLMLLEEAPNPEDKELVEGDVPLPPVTVPVFAGDYADWPAFEDLYSSVVHTRTDITPAYKMAQLMSRLHGEPHELLTHLAVSDSNYEVAWKILTDRYRNKRLIVDRLLDQWLSIPTITRGEWTSRLVKPSQGDLCPRHPERPGAPARGGNSGQPRRYNTALESGCAYCRETGHGVAACQEFAAQRVQRRRVWHSRGVGVFGAWGRIRCECPSSTNCRYCQGAHHPLLCMNRSGGAGAALDRISEGACPPGGSNAPHPLQGGAHLRIGHRDRQGDVNRRSPLTQGRGDDPHHGSRCRIGEERHRNVAKDTHPRCKRVEAPESAIECEEVVEDTNMQFPYCCTRLRCLVVVRGEVWTRVLGQPWETLPAAPWSHMYKMKKPPLGDSSFTKKEEGPVYELSVSDNEQGGDKAVLRSSRKDAECDTAVPRAAPPPPAGPDIVIALSTGSDKDSDRKKDEEPRPYAQRQRKDQSALSSSYYDDRDAQAEPAERNIEDAEDAVTEKEKLSTPQSDERYYGNPEPRNSYSTENPKPKHSWTEVPQPWNDVEQPAEHEQPPDDQPHPQAQQQRSMWNEPDQDDVRRAPDVQAQTSPAKTWEHQSNPNPGMEYSPPEEKKEEKPGNLQNLVDAIGSRMRDIETVVARMSEKVHQDRKQVQVDPEYGKGEPNLVPISRSMDTDQQYHDRKSNTKPKLKKPYTDEQYKSRGSKYLRSNGDLTTEPPLFVEDTNLNGYYSDASNSLLTRRTGPKEPPATYMAPVEIDTRRKNTRTDAERSSAETDKKHKKRIHKKKKTKSTKGSKGHHKKHHGKEDKRRKFRTNLGTNSVELDRQTSLEDSSAVGSSK